jgi:hypothetical protein
VFVRDRLARPPERTIHRVSFVACMVVYSLALLSLRAGLASTASELLAQRTSGRTLAAEHLQWSHRPPPHPHAQPGFDSCPRPCATANREGARPAYVHGRLHVGVEINTCECVCACVGARVHLHTLRIHCLSSRECTLKARWLVGQQQEERRWSMCVGYIAVCTSHTIRDTHTHTQTQRSHCACLRNSIGCATCGWERTPDRGGILARASPLHQGETEGAAPSWPRCPTP